MAKRVLVGVDLGGTSFLTVVTTNKGKILSKKKRKTRVEEGAGIILGRIADTVGDAVSSAGAKLKNIRAMGIGVPGPLNPETGVLLHGPNLGPTWNNTPVAAYLSERLGCPVYLGNDVNVGAVGEQTLGAARGYKDVVTIFIGTGIGGGLILNGKLYRGTRYTAGEIGHTVLLADGPLCGCGRQGCAEALASRTAIEREIWAGIAAGRPSAIPAILAEMGRQDMSSSVLAAALEQGDALTEEVMSKAQYYMGLLVASVVNLLDPQAVVLGGGLVERLGEDYVEPVREVAEQYYINQQERSKIHIVEAKLQDQAGALGAAIMARQSWERDRARKK
jgi:glucokinase